MMVEIQSETKFMWKLLLHILMIPFTVILILFKKKEVKDIFQPFYDIGEFLFEPRFTISMIILNIVVFFATLIFMTEDSIRAFISYPSDLTSLRLHTLITSGFLHADLSHLLGNMLALLVFGRVVERRLGPFKTMLVYFGALVISGLFTSVVHLFIMGDNVGGLGASGAIMGLIATAILLDPFYLTYELIIPLPIMIVGWLAIYADITGILNPVEDGIGHFAHLGGFISIALLGFLLSIEDKGKLRMGLMVNVISLVLAVAAYNFF
jgi:membrane associated rhomboid family serine protease